MYVRKFNKLSKIFWGGKKKGKKEKGEICIIDSLKRRLQRNLTLTARSSFMRLIIAAFYALNFSLVDMRRSPFNWNTEGRTGWAISRRGSEMADIRCVSFQGEKCLEKWKNFISIWIDRKFERDFLEQEKKSFFKSRVRKKLHKFSKARLWTKKSVEKF